MSETRERLAASDRDKVVAGYEELTEALLADRRSPVPSKPDPANSTPGLVRGFDAGRLGS